MEQDVLVPMTDFPRSAPCTCSSHGCANSACVSSSASSIVNLTPLELMDSMTHLHLLMDF